MQLLCTVSYMRVFARLQLPPRTERKLDCCAHPGWGKEV